MEKTGRFLTTVGEHPPVVMCEKHAKVFELAMSVNDIPHTIYEFDDETESQHCQACDLQVAKDYVRRVEEANQPRIILPGEFH
jgi:desulfoferrodoxin (superoxide reductase-like protein)